MAITISFDTFSAYLIHRGVTLCRAFVYDSIYGSGTGVTYENGYGATSIITPRNPIAAWRGTQFIKHFRTIKHETLYVVCYAGIRNGKETEALHHVINIIGWEKYKTIMTLPVPQEIIDIYTTSQERPPLFSLEEEKRAGTVE